MIAFRPKSICYKMLLVENYKYFPSQMVGVLIFSCIVSWEYFLNMIKTLEYSGENNFDFKKLNLFQTIIMKLKLIYCSSS